MVDFGEGIRLGDRLILGILLDYEQELSASAQQGVSVWRAASESTSCMCAKRNGSQMAHISLQPLLRLVH